MDASSTIDAGLNFVAFFSQHTSPYAGRKILHSNSSQHLLESPWMHQCTEIPSSTLEVCPTSVEKKKEVSYEDANKDIVKRKTSKNKESEQRGGDIC